MHHSGQNRLKLEVLPEFITNKSEQDTERNKIFKNAFPSSLPPSQLCPLVAHREIRNCGCGQLIAHSSPSAQGEESFQYFHRQSLPQETALHKLLRGESIPQATVLPKLGQCESLLH